MKLYTNERPWMKDCKFINNEKNIEQELYENKQILSYMLGDASNNNFIELLVTVNTTLQPH